ncbi:heavy metal translocating P-type ATPase [Myroides sp. JBRI-B21084]|uniref:heavy metal translocating P-type ATPase n=1 Tax=Myroides sp. JBRI-B21084 TaxID=3119977 RepID=UPI0026E1FE70|nr:heavy metal translocating P-type ATPase [Paenimyroides cloacae]WKW46783.1 heavy metal translocating P-type ATPase [Paenimyroides cloacae]
MKTRYKINEMTCSGCQAKVTEALQTVADKVEVSLNPAEAVIETNKKIALEDLQNALSHKGPYTIQEITINADGTEILSEIAHHAAHNHNNHNQPPKQLEHLAGKYYCPMLCEGDKVYDSNVGCPVCGMDLVQIGGSTTKNNEESILKTMFLQAAIVTVPVFFIAMLGMNHDSFIYNIIPFNVALWLQFLGATAVLTIGKKYLKRAYVSFKTLNLNMFSLIGLGAIAAYLFSIYVFFNQHAFHNNSHLPIYFESVAVIFTLMILGQWLEARAHKKTKSSLEHLLNLVPQKATLLLNGKTTEIDIDKVQINDELLVKPGEKIPVDGIIQSGNTSVNEALLTGEPLPVNKKENDEVLAGSINTDQSFTMKATRVGQFTTIAQIIEMVNKASLSRAPIQRLADKISGYFVPIVVFIAVCSFVYWGYFSKDPSLLFGLQNAISVLIIACPCALGLATPVSISVGIGKGAEYGILIKKAEALESLQKTNVLITDKTGTITEGKTSLEKIIPLKRISEEELIKITAQLNASSEHPIAKAFTNKAHELKIAFEPAKMVATIQGKGIQAVLNKEKVILGNEALLNQNNIEITEEIKFKVTEIQNQGKTVSYVSINNELVGLAIIHDAIKPGVKETVSFLQSKNIQIIMLTGDHKNTANAIAQQVGINNVFAQQLPQDKLSMIESNQKEGKIVTMIGDGINDAPALAKADIGIAMGNGSDLAQDFAKITLLNSSFSLVKNAYILSTKVMQNIKQNLFFAFVYNVIGIAVAAGVMYYTTGILLSPMIAALAMCLSSVSVIANALRLRKLKL